MIFHKMIEICLKDDNMHEFVMINALICINNHVITCINSMLSMHHQCELRSHCGCGSTMLDLHSWDLPKVGKIIDQ